MKKIIMTGSTVLLLLTAAAAADKLESTGKPSAVTTFAAIGITLPYSGDDNGDASCNVKFRPTGTEQWRKGYPLWRDSERHQFRGSLVMLKSNTTYEIKLSPQDPQGSPKSIDFTAKTWNEKFPIAQTVYISGNALTKGFKITKSGTAQGYIRYTAKPGTIIDVKHKKPHCITVSADYVIIDGLTLKGARQHAIRILKGSDIVIENCDISGWGEPAADGFGKNMQCAISSNYRPLTRVIIQNNTIHNPSTNSNNWTQARKTRHGLSKHPAGPQAVGFWDSAGNHVLRYNHIYSDAEHYYNDIFGCGANFGPKGFPNADSDIYGNILENCWDDAIESEGANKNVRIWGNYIEHAFKAIATRATSIGPLYIWRNVTVIGEISPGSQQGTAFHKSGGNRKKWDNGVFVFNNTAILPAGKTVAGSQTRGIEGAMLFTTTANNILAVEKSIISEIRNKNSNRFLNDLCAGKNYGIGFAAKISSIKGLPIFVADWGLNRQTGEGIFYQTKDSPGYNRGITLPNFNDNVPDGKPDIGAHEAGTPPMKFGPKAYYE